MATEKAEPVTAKPKSRPSGCLVGCLVASPVLLFVFVWVPLWLMNRGESDPVHNFQATIGIPVPAGAVVMHSHFFSTFGDATAQLHVRLDAEAFASFIEAKGLDKRTSTNGMHISAGQDFPWWKPSGDFYFSKRSVPRGLLLWHDAEKGEAWIYEMDNPAPDFNGPSF